MMSPLLINRKQDLQELQEIKTIIENNNNRFVKQELKKIDTIRILTKFFKQNYKDKINEVC